MATAGLPTEAEEVWRYGRVSEVDLSAYQPATDGWDAATAKTGLAEVLAQCQPAAAVVVVHNGQVVACECDPTLAEKGLFVGDANSRTDLQALLEDEPDAGSGGTGSSDAGTGDAFVQLNTAFNPGPLLIRVPAGMTVERPVVVAHWYDGSPSAPLTASFPLSIVSCGSDSDLTVVEHHASADVAALSAPVVRIELADAARLRFVSVQSLGAKVFQISYQRSRIQRDASLKASAVALGGDYARVRTDSRIEGKGGSAKLTAAYFADGQRMHDFRTLQDHAAPSSTSDLVFKGAVQDRSRSVYSGLIRVRKEAPGTSAFQTNRNLVLSDGARAESVPNLEIETDDVRCSHASAVGPIDEEQRYYLESRGIPPEVAERLIVLGFLADVIEQLPFPDQVTAIKETIALRLKTGAPAVAAQ